MATQQPLLVCDSSTLANFKSWAQTISSAFSTFGWLQSGDTGQVNWSTIASVPGSGAYIYEIWEPNDGLTNFYLKVEYGNFSGTNQPCVRLSMGTSTNGAGTLTGFVTNTVTSVTQGYTAPSSTTTYPCYLSGASGRFGALMWRTNAQPCCQLFAIERSINSSGSYTGNYVSLWVCGCGTAYGYSQVTLHFTAGVPPQFISNNSSTAAGWLCRMAQTNTSSFNGTIPLDNPAPLIGYYDYPCTVVGIGNRNDYSEGVTFTATVYGSTRTYVPTAFNGGHIMNENVGLTANCLRFD